MDNQHNSHSSGDTSIGNRENSLLIPSGISPGIYYPFEQAVSDLGMPATWADHIKKNYTNKGIEKLGYSYFCHGSEIIRIIQEESARNG